jgi:hypothetical protein
MSLSVAIDVDGSELMAVMSEAEISIFSPQPQSFSVSSPTLHYLAAHSQSSSIHDQHLGALLIICRSHLLENYIIPLL